jgi:hypothetical protein
MKPEPPRLAPELLLPAYAHVPGKTPHPFSDPRGHHHGVRHARPEAPQPDAWQACELYLHALDLFNYGYYWESHEVWEGLWLACGRHGMAADFLKGLIHLAAAGVKQQEGKAQGIGSHARRAAELWRAMGETSGTRPDRYFGLAVASLIELADRVSADGWPAEEPVLIPTQG